MTRVLQAGRKGPHSGTTRSVVVFLHGYGANGADLLGLADILGEHLPDTLFVAPDAPEAIPMMPSGYQWFPIPWIDGSSEEEAERGMQAAAQDVDAFLDALMVDEDVLPEQVVLFGFSQGTMLALHVAPRREDELAGIVGFSGWLLSPELLKEEVQSRPPVMLIHGDQDDLVPPQVPARGRRGAAGGGLARRLRPCDEGHRPRHRPGRAGSGAGLHARQAGPLSRRAGGGARAGQITVCMR